jgi:large subunit ribosomal protein L32
MSAVPKRKVSKSRKNMRRAHHFLTAPPSAACPKCGEPRAPHRVCGFCGTYGDRQVLPESKLSSQEA